MPGCGDYAILAAVQSFMPELGLPRERIVFISGIGCAARFPYYMQTYGMHSIHGRAPAIATGLAVSRPDLSVWVVSGDGDSLSIGGNHLIHALRRNVNIKILMFNNRIYGLTKGQYSPTSEQGKVTGSTPLGSVDYPFNPLSVALGAEATFVARAIDTDKKGLTDVCGGRRSTAGLLLSRSSRTATSTTTAPSTSPATTRTTASTCSTASRRAPPESCTTRPTSPPRSRSPALPKRRMASYPSACSERSSATPTTSSSRDRSTARRLRRRRPAGPDRLRRHLDVG